jgi:hypothetical protein
MTIPAASQLTPIPALNGQTPLVTSERLPTQETLTALDKWRSSILGTGRIIPCHATGKNTITLLPTDASPTLEGYRFGDAFLFWQETTSDGSVTARVQPKSTNAYVLTTIKVYVSGGAAQAGAGDVVAGSVYAGYFAPHLDGGNGGIVLK